MGKILDWIKKFFRRVGLAKPDVKLDVFDCEFCYPHSYDDYVEPRGTCKVRRTIVDGVVSQVLCRLYDPEGDKCSSTRNETGKCFAVAGMRQA